MFGRLQFLLFSSVVLVILIAVPSGNAQTNSLPKARPGILPFQAEVGDGKVTFSWQVAFGKWELLAQDASSGKWTPVPAEQYHTNANIVSATLPVPKEATLYRVKRNVASHSQANLPGVPQVPEVPTNRPPPKLPKRP